MSAALASKQVSAWTSHSAVPGFSAATDRPARHGGRGTRPPLPGEATFADALRLVREALPEETETVVENVAETLILRSVRRRGTEKGRG